MIHYVTVDKDGFISGSGSVQLKTNLPSDAIEVEEPINTGLFEFKCKLVDGRAKETNVPYFEKSYSLKRYESYPPIGEQLDALWHAMDQGLIPVVPTFYEPIKTVKETYPKPANS